MLKLNKETQQQSHSKNDKLDSNSPPSLPVGAKCKLGVRAELTQIQIAKPKAGMQKKSFLLDGAGKKTKPD